MSPTAVPTNSEMLNPRATLSANSRGRRYSKKYKARGWAHVQQCAPFAPYGAEPLQGTAVHPRRRRTRRSSTLKRAASSVASKAQYDAAGPFHVPSGTRQLPLAAAQPSRRYVERGEAIVTEMSPPWFYAMLYSTRCAPDYAAQYNHNAMLPLTKPRRITIKYRRRGGGGWRTHSGNAR